MVDEHEENEHEVRDRIRKDTAYILARTAIALALVFGFSAILGHCEGKKDSQTPMDPNGCTAVDQYGGC